MEEPGASKRRAPLFCTSPSGRVSLPVHQRLRQVRRADGGLAREVGDGAGHLQNPADAAPGELQTARHPCKKTLRDSTALSLNEV